MRTRFYVLLFAGLWLALGILTWSPPLTPDTHAAVTCISNDTCSTAVSTATPAPTATAAPTPTTDGSKANTTLNNLGTTALNAPLLAADGSSGAPSYAFTNSPGSGFYYSGGAVLSGSALWGWGGSFFVIKDGYPIAWSTTSNPIGGAWDVALVRNSTRLLKVTDSSTGFSDVKLRHVAGGGTAPTITAGCGASPSLSSTSTDFHGNINVGTGGVATTCTITFNAAFAAAPDCLAQDVTTASVGLLVIATTTTTMQVTAAGAFTASDHVVYHCMGV